VYYTERKPKNKERGRPGNEANVHVKEKSTVVLLLVHVKEKSTVI